MDYLRGFGGQRIAEVLGNKTLLELPKPAFLWSRKVPTATVLKCYDWAIDQRDAGNCVISGFYSTLERNVLHYLRKGSQPIIVVLHRGIGPETVIEFEEDTNRGRLLVISPFQRNVKHGDGRTALLRNRMIIDLADEIVIGHASPGGSIDKLIAEISKPVRFM